jgi:hypothetical protein
MEKPVINPSFIGILSFRGCDWVFSVLNGGDIGCQENPVSFLSSESSWVAYQKIALGISIDRQLA